MITDNKRSYRVSTVGKTGGGKSMLLNNIARCFDADYLRPKTLILPPPSSHPVADLAKVLQTTDDKVLHFHAPPDWKPEGLQQQVRNEEEWVKSGLDPATFRRNATVGFADYVLPSNTTPGATSRHHASTTGFPTTLCYGERWSVEFKFLDLDELLDDMVAHDFRCGPSVDRVFGVNMGRKHRYLVSQLVNLVEKPDDFEEVKQRLLASRKKDPDEEDMQVELAYWVDLCQDLSDSEMAQLFKEKLVMKQELKALSAKTLCFHGNGVNDREFVRHVIRIFGTLGVYASLDGSFPPLDTPLAPSARIIQEVIVHAPLCVFGNGDNFRFVDLPGLNDSDPLKLHMMSRTLDTNRVLDYKSGPDGSYALNRRDLVGMRAMCRRTTPRHLYVDSEVCIHNSGLDPDSSVYDPPHVHPVQGRHHFYGKYENASGGLAVDTVKYFALLRLAATLEGPRDLLSQRTNGKDLINVMVRNANAHPPATPVNDVQILFIVFKMNLADRVKVWVSGRDSRHPERDLIDKFTSEFENGVIFGGVFEWDSMRRDIHIAHPEGTTLTNAVNRTYDAYRNYEHQFPRDGRTKNQQDVLDLLQVQFNEARRAAAPYTFAFDLILQDIRTKLAKVMFKKMNIKAVKEKSLTELIHYLTEEVVLGSIPDTPQTYSVIEGPAIEPLKPYQQSALWLEGWACTKYLQLEMLSYLRLDYLDGDVLEGGTELNHADLLLNVSKPLRFTDPDKGVEVKRTPGYTDEEGDKVFQTVLQQMLGVAEKVEMERVRGLCQRVFYEKTHVVEGLAELLMCRLKVKEGVVVVPRYRILPPAGGSKKKKQRMVSFVE